MIKASHTGNGEKLFTIYQNLFQGSVLDIQYFQTLASWALLNDDGRKAFEAMLTRLNNGEDPQLTVEEIEALAYLMGASDKASLVRPWDDTPAW